VVAGSAGVRVEVEMEAATEAAQGAADLAEV